jgi:hypothetical protein
MSQWPGRKEKGNYIMRTVFTIELKADIDMTDDARRKVFIDLVLEASRQIYGQATMVARNAPAITVSAVSRQGKESFNVFPTQEAEVTLSE